MLTVQKKSYLKLIGDVLGDFHRKQLPFMNTSFSFVSSGFFMKRKSYYQSQGVAE
jgi:hypothetical protein